MYTSISCESQPVPGFAGLFQRLHMGPFGPDDGGTDSEPCTATGDMSQVSPTQGSYNSDALSKDN